MSARFVAAATTAFLRDPLKSWLHVETVVRVVPIKMMWEAKWNRNQVRTNATNWVDDNQKCCRMNSNETICWIKRWCSDVDSTWTSRSRIKGPPWQLWSKSSAAEKMSSKKESKEKEREREMRGRLEIEIATNGSKLYMIRQMQELQTNFPKKMIDEVKCSSERIKVAANNCRQPIRTMMNRSDCKQKPRKSRQKAWVGSPNKARRCVATKVLQA